MDEGVAPGPGGAEAAPASGVEPPEMGQFLCMPTEVCVVTCAHYACVADCANAMADAWKDTVGCAQAICLHENLLKCRYIVKWGLHGIVHI